MYLFPSLRSRDDPNETARWRNGRMEIREKSANRIDVCGSLAQSGSRHAARDRMEIREKYARATGDESRKIVEG